MRDEAEEEEVECVRFPCGAFPGMESFSIYSLAGCYLFSSTDTWRYCSLSRVLAGEAGSVADVPVSDVCGHCVCSSSEMSVRWIDEPFGGLCPPFVYFLLPSPSVDPPFPGHDPAQRCWICQGWGEEGPDWT